jgi:phage terminase small subunit
MNQREIDFCEAYLVHQNAKQACLDAGYASTTASRMAIRLLKRSTVQEYLGRLTEKVAARAVADATTVVNSYAAIASASPLDCLVQNDSTGYWEGCKPEDLPADVRPAIAKVHIRDVKSKNGTVTAQRYSYELHDRMAALLQLGKHFQVFGEAPTVSFQLNQFSNVSSDKLEAIASAFQDAMHTKEREVDGEVLSNA